jgi:hypothetical protein
MNAAAISRDIGDQHGEAIELVNLGLALHEMRGSRRPSPPARPAAAVF